MKRIFSYIMVIFLSQTVGVVWATPDSISITGGLVHGQSKQITGEGFGSKTTPAPVLWDDCTDNTKLSTYYSQTLPTSAQQGSTYNAAYRDTSFLSGRSVTLPHDKGTYAISGAHATDATGYATGNNVGVTIANTSSTWYALYWYRIDPVYDDQCIDADDCPEASIVTGLGPYDNLKEMAINNGTTMYSSPWGYWAWCDPIPNVNNTGTANFQKYDIEETTGYTCIGNNVVEHQNPVNGWMQMEWKGDYDDTEDNPQIELTTFPDHERTYLSHYGNALTTYESATQYCASQYGCPEEEEYSSVSLGGFARVPRHNNGQNSFRYWYRIYFDTTYSRVILANNQTYASATIIAPQLPTAWAANGTSITVTVNQGAIPDGTAYLFVFDSGNSHNSIGYPVIVGGGGTSGSPVPPTGLRIVEK